LVSRQKRIVIIGLMLLLLVAQVNAFSLRDLIFERFTDPSGELTECNEIYTEEECMSYCSGNREDARCTYPSETKRIFSVQLYPTDCEYTRIEQDVGGGVSGSDYVFIYDIDLNRDKNFEHILNDKCENFPQYLKSSRYSVSSGMINNIKLYDSWWIDPNGLPYLEKPGNSDLRDFYGDEVDFDINDLKTKFMAPSKYSLLNVKFDCDYTGEDDIEFNGFYSSKDPTSQKELLEIFDYTESNIFSEDFQYQNYNDYYSNIYEDNCQGLGSFISQLSYCTDVWLQSNPAFNFLSKNQDLVFTQPGDKEYKSEFLFSTRNSANVRINCEYPDSDYNDGDQVTLKVSSKIAYSREHLLLSGAEIVNDMNEDLDLECNEGNNYCTQESLLTFNISGTNDSRKLVYVESDFIALNQTDKEVIDDTRADIHRPPAPKLQSQSLKNYNEEFSLDDFELGTDKAYRDKNQEDAVSMVKEFSLYLVSFNMLIVYLLQISLFMGIFVLVMNSFRHAKNAFKKVFMIGGKR